MGTMLEALLNLQSIERQLADVRRRLATRKRAVAAQQARIDQARNEYEAIHEKALSHRKNADSLELDLKAKEEQVAKLRTALNAAKTNKEYSAILTQINTYKADNAKVEEDALKTLQEVEAVKVEAEKAQLKIQEEEKRLADVQATSASEIENLDCMVGDLETRRAEASKSVPPEPLSIFNRIASGYEGDAMAQIEVHGRKPPFEYVCGGCYMSLNAEHANVLRFRDEIRRCDNCGRILYLEITKQQVSRE